MNTIGKILVVLNFLFAIIVGALLIMVLAVHDQWKAKYFALVENAQIEQGINKSNVNAQVSVVTDYKSALIALERERQSAKDKKEEADAVNTANELKIKDLDNKLKEKDTQLDIAKLLTKRQADEIALLNKTIEARQSTIVLLEAEVKNYRGIAANFEQIARDGKLKNEVLLEQIRELTVAVTKKEGGVDGGTGMLKVNQPMRPAVEVEGKITKVLDNLVQVSLGTDNGIKENHTLDVYRLQPNPTYLGRIQITDAYHHTAVGRFVPSSAVGVRPPQLKEGDVVSSKIR
jgi:hypothetical protein